MKMRTLLALLLALVLLLSLGACDWFTKITDDDDKTTAATTTADSKDVPPLSGSPMEPLQGGPMLYTFYGSKPYRTEISEYDGEEYPIYPIGLIDRDGKLVSPAVYHNADYIYDEAGQRVTGLAAVKGREITIYQLDGKSRVLPCEGWRIDVFPGGRYAVVYTADFTGQFGGNDYTDPLREGIYDLQKNKFAVEPKEGQMIQYAAGGLALGYQHDTPDATGDETAQWAFKCEDESIVELPFSLGRVQQYFPETGWFGAMWMQGEWEQRVYDKDLNIIPALTGWSVDYMGFNGGEWCLLYNNSAFPDVTTWVNRKGELSDKRVKGIYPNDWQCYLIESGGSTTLLDTDLNEVVKTRAGEELVALLAMGDSARSDGFALVDADGAIKAAYGLDAKPMQVPAAFRCWFNDATNGVYSSLGGQLRALDLAQFQPKAQAEDRDAEPYARAIAVSEGYVVVETGVHWYDASVEYNTYAVDWDGEFVDDCPLQPFFGLLSWRTAGEQGPYYYWIETPSQRGYINTKGEWLFVDEG